MNTTQIIISIAAAIIIISFVVAWIGKPKKGGVSKSKTGGPNYPDENETNPNTEISDGK